MARGNSGKIVVEVDVALKRELYATLSREGLTMKEWVTRTASAYIVEHHQPSLDFSQQPHARRQRSQINAQTRRGEEP